MRRLDLGRLFGSVLGWHCLFHLIPDDQELALPIFARHLIDCVVEDVSCGGATVWMAKRLEV